MHVPQKSSVQRRPSSAPALQRPIIQHWSASRDNAAASKRRSSLASTVHPLTRQQNKDSAENIGTFIVKHDVLTFSKACRCQACCSPRGSWRDDSLQVEVEDMLASFKDKPESDEDIEVASPKEKSSPSTAQRRARQLRGGSDMTDGESPPVTPSSFLAAEKRRRAQRQKISQDCCAIGGADALGFTPSRPSSAPAGGRGACGNKRETRAQAALERKRQLHEGFVQKCRAAWDAKLAFMQSREQQHAAERSAAYEELRQLAKQRKNLPERARHWMRILAIVRSVHCFQEIAVSGRMLLLASLGGTALEKQLSWGKAASGATEATSTSFFGAVFTAQARRSISKAPATPVAVSSVFENLRRARFVASVFPDIKTTCQSPLKPDEEDGSWTSYTEKVQQCVVKRERAWKQWGLPLLCTMALARLRCRQRIQRAGRIVRTALTQMTSTNSIFIAIKGAFLQIRKIQWAVKDWIAGETARYNSIVDLFVTAEKSFIKKRWSEDDRKAIRDAKQHLLKVRVVKERKLWDRMLAISKERYRRYTKPQNDSDRQEVQRQLEKCRVPLLIRNLTSQHIYSVRKILVKQQLAEHAKHLEVYHRDLHHWQDIDRSVKILDPSSANHDPMPEAPVYEPYGFTISQQDSLSIVSQIHAWCKENQRLVQSQSEPRPVVPETPWDRLRARRNSFGGVGGIVNLAMSRSGSKSSACSIDSNYMDACSKQLSRLEMKIYMERMPRRHREESMNADLLRVSTAACDIVKAAMRYSGQDEAKRSVSKGMLSEGSALSDED